MGFIAEMLGYRERGQARPPTRTGRLVHLTENKRRARQHARLLEFGQIFHDLRASARQFPQTPRFPNDVRRWYGSTPL